MKRTILVAFFINFLFITGHSQNAAIDISKKIYTTQKIETALQPKIDGRLDDLIWNTANWSGDFIQREPLEGASPSESTVFSMVYDEQYLYIGIKCFDAIPSSCYKT